LDAGSLGPHVQAKSTATLSDLLSMYTGRVLKKPSPQLLLTPDEQSDCDEANDISGDNQTWHNTQNNMPSSHMLSSIVTKEKSCVQNINTAVNKIEDDNPKKVDYIDEKETHTTIFFSFLFFFFLFFLIPVLESSNTLFFCRLLALLICWL